jgi:hypothetical protein
MNFFLSIKDNADFTLISTTPIFDACFITYRLSEYANHGKLDFLLSTSQHDIIFFTKLAMVLRAMYRRR